MSKQFRVYITPSDVEALVGQLRLRVGITIIDEYAPDPKPVVLDSPLHQKPAISFLKERTSVRCYIASSCNADLKFQFLPKRFKWLLSDTSEAIEFSGCDYDGSTLLIGRFYFQTDMLINDSIWPKRKEFLNWADKIFKTTKELLHRSPELNAYVGKDAERFRQEGGQFASSWSSTGQPRLN